MRATLTGLAPIPIFAPYLTKIVIPFFYDCCHAIASRPGAVVNLITVSVGNQKT